MSRHPGRALLAITAAGALAGCVYYNGVYNARRLTSSAEKAERDGRTLDAGNYWAQVVVKSDSVIARHPGSKWVQDAVMYRGLALSRLARCPEALVALRRVIPLLQNPDQLERANFALGRCELETGSPAAAIAPLERAAVSRDRNRRDRAQLLYARALRGAGRAQDAVAVLGRMGPAVRGERLIAVGAAGPTEAALALADSLVARHDSLMPWDSALVALGQRDPAGASTLIDHLRAAKVARARHGEWLVADAERLVAVDPARAQTRLQEAVAESVSGEAAERARVALSRSAIRSARSVEELTTLGDSLLSIDRDGAAGESALVLRQGIAVVRAADSVRTATPQGDLRLFLAAETARHALGSTAVALSLLHRIAADWPQSPYAAKALLATMTLDSTAGDSIRTVLESRYAASPYVAALRGEDAEGYRALEDSLGAYAVALAAERVGPGRRGRVRPRRDDADSMLSERPLGEERPRPTRPAASARPRVEAQP